jgi:hypothetical protein
VRRWPLTTRFLLWIVFPLCIVGTATVLYLRQGLPGTVS